MTRAEHLKLRAVNKRCRIGTSPEYLRNTPLFSKELVFDAVQHDVLRLDVLVNQALAMYILYAQDRLVKKCQDVRVAVRTANLVPACSRDPFFAALATLCLHALCPQVMKIATVHERCESIHRVRCLDIIWNSNRGKDALRALHSLLANRQAKKRLGYMTKPPGSSRNVQTRIGVAL